MSILQNLILLNQPSLSRRQWFVDIIFLNILLILFYTLWLGSYPLFTPDEGRYGEIAREMVATGDYITPRLDGVAFLDKPIFYYWLQTIAIQLLGVNEWALRIFPALFGVMGCLITYICGRHLFDRHTALLAAMILATTPLYFSNAHYANLDLEVSVLISGSLLCQITGFQLTKPSRHYFLYASYVFAALACLTKGLIGIVFPLLIGGAWIVILRRWDIFKKIQLLAGAIIFIAIVLPWYLMAQSVNPKFLHYFFITQQISRFLSVSDFNNKTPFWFYIPIILIGFFPWSIFIAEAFYHNFRCISQRVAKHPVELFLLLWISIIFLFFSVPHSKTIGYILPIFPALALLVGRHVSVIWKNPVAIYRYTAGFLLSSSLLALILLALANTKIIVAFHHFYPYLITIAIVILTCVLTALLFIKTKTFFSLFVICAICSSISLTTMTMGASALNRNTLKPLIFLLKKFIRPDDEIIHYFRYYQDVPLYLKKKVTIVADWDSPTITLKDNWIRELWFGMRFQPTDTWLINDKTFWERWDSNKRVFVFMHINYFVLFKPKIKPYFFLGQYHDIVLLSNQSPW